MSEKQKAIYLEEWLIESIQREAAKHHRSWMREVQAILEEVIFDRQNIEKAESENK
jgi:plasmid stability protein